jgi:hypothetical protein
VLQLEAIEVALEFSHFIHICPHMWTIIGLVYLVDHQLGVTPHEKARDTQACRDPEISKQAFVFRCVVGGVFTGEG